LVEIDDPASDVVGAALHPRGRLLIAILDDQFRDPIAIFLDLHANILSDSAISRTMVAFYHFPAEHWKHLRTTNVIESSFATVRHRTVRSKGCLSNKTALAMIFKLAETAEKLSSGPYPARAPTVGITADSVRFGICRKNAQTKAEIRPNKASPYNPPAKLPVQSFIKPTYHGPKKPPRYPAA
jgi:Transposase, Mutator family